MKTTAQKTAMNMALKLAMVKSRRTQRQLALLTGIGEVRLSGIVRQRGVPATKDERRALARVLHTSQAALFVEIGIDDAEAQAESHEAVR